MHTLPEDYKAPLLGAAIAILAGLGIGASLKAEVDPSSSYGTQLQISKPGERARSAFDDWYPAEGAPPPVYQTAALRDDSMSADAIDREIARLMNAHPAEVRPAAYQQHWDTDPTPVQTARREPDPYLPSARGDILAAGRYEPPPADPPRWGWALPDADAPVPADAPPELYEDGAAG